MAMVDYNSAFNIADFETFQTNTEFTTIGSSLATLTNPSALGYLRTNVDNSVTHRTYANVKIDLGLGTMADESSTT